MHAISGAAAVITFEPVGSVSVYFLPEFLAKNLVPGSVSLTLVFPALTRILGSDDADRFYVQCVRLSST